jgi:hypothetical protein
MDGDLDGSTVIAVLHALWCEKPRASLLQCLGEAEEATLGSLRGRRIRFQPSGRKIASILPLAEACVQRLLASAVGTDLLVHA